MRPELVAMEPEYNAKMRSQMRFDENKTAILNLTAVELVCFKSMYYEI